MKKKREKKYELCLIGAGNMGEAIISGLLAKKLFSKKGIMAIDVSMSRRKQIKKKYGITCTEKLSFCRQSKRVLLAVKPQDIKGVLREIRNHVQKGQLIISIVAGKTLQSIEKAFPFLPPVVRVMPNTPALVRQGVSGVCFNKKVTSRQKKEATRIMKSIGQVIIFKEKAMNAVTAVSGSGPAYVFYFLEAYLQAAKGLGLHEKDAEVLVTGTIRGALALLLQSGEAPEGLRKKVTSKGGTTEAALKIFDKKKFRDIFKQAVKAAEKRGRELNKM
ncbi:MAG: pyrroline-5-carboxylate reductase [Candidatus Aureabacteria bacterium]|nr:pyrroline-5-carboxylate reductase [Candidatus Auribacterota bacterium]